MNILHFKKQKGFTLVETLVALSIFSSAIVGMIVITSQGINDTVYAKNKLIATALSQEGIEVVRNIRDSSLLADPTGLNGWTDFLATISDCTTGACTIDPLYQDIASLNISECASPEDCHLKRDTSLSSYGYYETQGAGNESPYMRTIEINELDPNTVEIVCTVSWLQGSGGLKEVVSREHLMNWFSNTP